MFISNYVDDTFFVPFIYFRRKFLYLKVICWAKSALFMKIYYILTEADNQALKIIEPQHF